MKRQPWWNHLSDEEILNLRVCDLKLDLKNSWVWPKIQKIYKELEAKGLSFRPHFWVSDDWFSPDGIPGIAIPFYILHPRLQQLEKKYIGRVEGGTSQWCLKILRHEVGHAIENAFLLRRKKERRELFGKSSQPYPKDYSPRPYSTQFVRHLEGHYAQAHPDEDFAETFAVWLTPRSAWKKQYAGTGALEKLRYIEKTMLELQGKKPLKANRECPDEHRQLEVTLRQFYQKRILQTKDYQNSFFPRGLYSLFGSTPQRSSRVKSRVFLRQQRKHLCRQVAKEIQQYQYKVEPMLKEIELLCAKKNLYLKVSQDKAKRELLELLPQQAKRYLQQKRDWILM